MLILTLVLILLLVISLFFCIIYIINQRNLYRQKIDYRNFEKADLIEEKNLLLNMNITLKEQLDAYEQKETTYSTPNGTIEKIDIFKNKKALIGDYSSASYYNTKMVLLSLGFDVDIIGTINDIEKLIKSKCKYDVIFTNNLYRNGTGKELLERLKNIKDFNTPVILHSITSNLENYSLENGFDGFLPKPIKQEYTTLLLKKLLNTA